jgi:Tol biopolymer transport system component
MDLTTGTRLGPYEIVSRIGAGGMGEVFRARDTRLERIVAIKVLPDAFAADVRLRLRFEREAKSISQLNHPHICALYDVGEQDGVSFLVMEFVDGETLAARISRGAMAPNEVMRYGAEIAEALDRAHRAGVVHRDVKPANIMITKSGAKLLDFGLARNTEDAAVADGDTVQKALTDKGTVVGTVQYMAPEQLTGENGDARTDIFALGAVLYEMSTGKRAFDGKTRASLAAAILSAAPLPLRQEQPLAPAALQRLVSKCLEKDPDDRWQSAKDIAGELRWIPSQADVRDATRRISPWPWIIAAVAAIAAIAMYSRRTAPRVDAAHLEITPPAGWLFREAYEAPFAVSPDGTSIVFAANPAAGGDAALWLKKLGEPGAVALSGTEGARHPFWSPDGRAIGFYARSGIRRVSLSGGDVTTIADPNLRLVTGGATWVPGDEIVYCAADGLYKVPAKGGQSRRIAAAAPKTAFVHPTYAGDGVLLAGVLRLADGDRKIVAVPLAGGEQKLVVESATSPTYLASGDLAFVAGDTLFVQPFDVSTLHLRGERTAVAKPVAIQFGIALYSIARDGATVMYQPVGSRTTNLVVMDRSGRETSTGVPSATIADPYLSRDGSRALFALSSDGAADVWTLDLARSVSLRLTPGDARNAAPALSPDGKQVVFTSDRDLFLMNVAGGQRRTLLADPSVKFASDWSPDGRYILFTKVDAVSNSEIHALSVSDGSTFPVVQSRFSDRGGRFSPDGKWVVYLSFESGAGEIYVQRFPGGEDKTRISTSSGVMPTWSADGKEIFYITRDQLVSCEISYGKELSVSPPRMLFDLPALTTANPAYVPFPDGQRFLAVKRVSNSQSRVANVILNWQAKQR